MTDPASTSGLGKLAGLIAKPLYALARGQFDRRGAESIAAADPASIDKEIKEAISVLRREGDTASHSAWVYIKSILSDRPPVFDAPETQDWLRRDDVQNLLLEATLALIANQDLTPFEDEARRLYGISADEADWWGGPLFEYTVSFIALTLKARASFDARLLLVAAEGYNAVVRDELRDLKAATLQQTQLLESLAGSTKSAPVDVIDRYLAAEIKRRDSLRSIAEIASVAEVVALGERVHTGDLAAATGPARANTYRFVAATLARNRDPDAAQGWLDAALREGANDVDCDRARIALQRREFTEALSHLDGRDDPLSKSLRLDVIHRRDGQEAAVGYFEQYGSAGQVTGFFLPSIANWFASERNAAAGEALLAEASDDQVLENRLLRFHRLRFRLALCVAPGDQARVIAEHGMLPPPWSLRDDAEGHRLKALALEDARVVLADIERDAPQGFVELLQLSTAYLALVSPDEAVRAEARASVTELLKAPDTRVIYTPLSIMFDIDFDKHALAAQLDQAARLSGWDEAELRAAFDLAVDSHDAQRITSFVDHHRERVIAIAGPRYAIGIQIEALAKAGRIVEAREKLEQATELNETDARFLEDLIKDAIGEGSPDLHLERFEQTDLEQDLYLFVEALRQSKDPRLPEFAYQLWQRRRRISDAVIAANAFARANRNIELRDFLEELGDTISIEPALQAHLAWIRYREGRIEAAETLLRPLRLNQPDDESLRQLRVNLALEAGEWHSLDDLFREDLGRAEHRSARQLMQSATLATALGNPEGKALLRAAVAKAGDDAHLYAHAFLLALRRGEDLEDEPIEWFNRAVELSDDEGPLRPFEVREVIAIRDQEAERAATIDRLVLSGQVPMALATKPQGTSLAGLILLFSALNEGEIDARKRFYLPTYAGNRLQPSLEGAKRIAIEPIALFVLHRLGVLEETIQAFEKVIIPAGTLPSLLNAAMDGNRGQPSRLQRAQEVLRLVRSQRLRLLEAAAEGIDPIDHMFAAARLENGRLIHIPPLHVPGSLGEEVRDPEPFLSRLASVSGIVDALRVRGEISEAEASRARRFPSVRATWDGEAPVDLDRPLILDAISLHYLMDSNLLPALGRIGTPVLVLPDTVERAEAELVDHEQIMGLFSEIENVRSTLNAGLRSGRLEIGPALGGAGGDNADDEDDEEGLDPLLAVLQDSGGADWLIADDRTVNQHGQFNDSVGVTNGIATSLDVLRHLLAEARIDDARFSACLHRLRMSGFGLIPVHTEEIVAAAVQGDWHHGPSRTLRAIRDSVILPVLRQSIVLPLEHHWFEQTLLAVAQSIKACFRTMSEESATSAAQFLFALLPDLRAIASRENSPEAVLWADKITAGVMAILATPIGPDEVGLEAYHRWFEGEAAERLQGRDNDLFDEVVARLKDVVLKYRDRLVIAEGDVPPPPDAVARWIFVQIPELLRKPLGTDDEIREALARAKILSLDGFKVRIEDLNAFLTEAAQGREAALSDVNGEQISESVTVNEDGSVMVTRGQRCLRFEHAALFSPELPTRRAAMQSFLAEHTLSPSAEAIWRDRVIEGPLDSEAMQQLSEEAQHTAEVFVQTTTEAMAQDDFDIKDIADVPEHHFLSFAEEFSREGALDAALDQLAERRSKGTDPLAAAVASAPMAVAPGFSIEAFTGPLTDEAAVGLATRLIEEGDPFSLLAAFQLVVARIADPSWHDLGARLVEELWGADGSASNLAEDFCTGAMATGTICRWNGQLRDWPLAGRRLAILGHAGLICRVFRHYQIERPGFYDQVKAWFGPQFRLGALVERASAPTWSLNWLIPDAVEAYLLRRFDDLLDMVAEEARPQTWLDTIRKRAERLGAPACFLAMGGPLDEMSDRGHQRPAMLAKDFDALVKLVDVAPTLGVADVLLRVAMVFAPPIDISVDPLIEVIVARADEAEAHLRYQYHQVSLELAMSWRFPALAERIASLVLERDMNGSALAEQALAVAASQHSEEERREVLRQQMVAGARTRRFGDPAQSFDRVLEALSNGEPSLAAALFDARIITALAL